jgi:putative DNA primase/helicase
MKYSVIITNPKKYSELTGLTNEKNAEHSAQEIKILLNENCITLPKLTILLLENKKIRKLETPDERQDITPEEILATRITESTDFPLLCRKAVKEIGIYYDDNKYWWIWNEMEYKWQETDETEILNKIDSKITESSNTIESKIKNMLIEALKREGRKNKPKELDWHWIQFKKELINFKTKEKMVATPDYFVSNPIPWEIGQETSTPILDSLFSEWINTENEKKSPDYLKELFAFTIASKYFITKVPFLYGSGSDGKSQFIKTLVKFIGQENYTSTSLTYLEKSQFGTYSLRKKLLCSVNELPKNQIDQFTTIKTISGRDPIYLEKKGHDRITETLYSKIFLVGNDVPICTDMSDGFARRIILIHFPNHFKEGGDIFEKIPDQEFSNLSLWCLEKLNELEQKYSFICDCDDLKSKKENYKKISNQVIHFMKDEGYVLTGKNSDSIMVTDLFSHYNRWAESNNKELLNYKSFKAKLENLGVSTDNDYAYIKDNKVHRLFAFGVKFVPVLMKNEG